MTGVEGATALVTGAGNGIGRAIALAFASAGSNVVVADVLADDGRRTVAEIAQRGGAGYFVEADVSDEDQVRGLVDAATERFGGLDILANNAGIGGGRQRLHEIAAADFERVIRVNLIGTFLCSKYVLPHFLSRGQGQVINTASTYGVIGAPNAAAYCASKGGIINLTRQMAVDYGPDGIRVNAICPGYIDTHLGRRGESLSAQEFQEATAIREKAAGMQPLRRQGTPSEVAEVVLFLASEAASFMTGAIVPVDGGCLTTFNYGDRSN